MRPEHGPSPFESALPAETPTALDRPITVPLLVRGAFDKRLVVTVLVLSSIFFVLGFVARYKRPWYSGGPRIAWFLGTTLAVPTITIALWRWRRQRWLEVTPTGFILTEHGTKQSLLDEQIVGIARGFKIDSGKITHHRIRLEIKRDRIERIDCTYSVMPGLPDPMAGFWDRLIFGLARRVRANLATGARLEGDHWSLDTQGLHHGGSTIPIERIRKVAFYEHRLCLWKDNDERPFARISAKSRNVQALGVFVSEDLRARSDAQQPLPGNPLGRILFDHRSFEWQFGVAMVGLALLVTGFLVYMFLSQPRPLRIMKPAANVQSLSTLEAVILFGVLTGLYVVGGFAIYRGRTNRLVFHEFGVSQPARKGARTLFYTEIGTVIWKNALFIILRPRAGIDKPEIRFRTGTRHRQHEDDLAQMRDFCCYWLARNWADELHKDPIVWTPRLRFLPGGLEYRPRGFLGDEEPVTIPYHLTSYQIQNSVFSLFEAGLSRAVCREWAGVPNFYPGLMLLDWIYHSFQQPALPTDRSTFAARPLPQAPRDHRIKGHDPRNTSFQSGEDARPTP